MHKDRIKFRDFELTLLPDGTCSSVVELAWGDKDTYIGRAKGVNSSTGILRCSAEAAANALEQASPEELRLELLGVKSVKAFDSVLVVVSLSSAVAGADRQRLVGSTISQGQPARGAALAVLSATNRLLGNIIQAQ